MEIQLLLFDFSISVTEIRQQVNKVLPEFRKDCAISIQQKCKLHKPRRAIWRNRFEFSEPWSHYNYSIIQFFSNFSAIKNLFFLRLERCECLGNSRRCFLSNEIRSNVNANSWITNERNSSMELFLLILVSSSLISLSRHISSIACQLKPCFAS